MSTQVNLVYAVTKLSPVTERDIEGVTTALAPYCGSNVSDFLVHRAKHAFIVTARRSNANMGIASEQSTKLVVLGTPYRNEKPIQQRHNSRDSDAQNMLTGWLQDHDYKNENPGNFASFILAEATNQLHIIVGRGSTRTIYCGKLQNAVHFSTHLGALAACQPGSRIDRSYEDFFLLYGFHPYHRTLLANVEKISAGERITANLGKISNLDKPAPTNRGQRVASRHAAPESIDHVTKNLYKTFMGCLEEQSSPQSANGVLLGGFDSALVAAGLHRLGCPVRTYSFSYESSEYNQRHTKELAEFLGIEHRWVPIDANVIREGIENYARWFNAPTNWPNYVIQTAHVCRSMADEGIEHCFSGDGCDGLFLGYPGTYTRAKYFARLPRLPHSAVAILLTIFGRKLLERKIGHPYRILLNMLRAMQRPMPSRAFLTFRVLDELSLRQLRKNHPVQAESVEETISQLSASMTDKAVAQIGYEAKQLVSPNKIKLTGASDASGIPIDSPYLHPRMKSLVESLPVSFLRPSLKSGNQELGKYILMKMAEDYKLLPASVIHQPKYAAINAPIDEWYQNELRDAVDSILHYLPFPYDESYIDTLVRESTAEKAYKRWVGSTKVISDAVSLLVTYAAFCKLTKH